MYCHLSSCYALTFLGIHLLFQNCVAHPPPRTNTAKPQKQHDYGLQLLPGGCTGSQLSAMETAILDAGLLVNAALNAASNFTQVPFNYFFKSDIQTANIVAGVLRRVQSALQGKGDLVNVTCTDTYRQCRVSVEHLILGYTAHIEPPLIVLCALALSLPRNPKPCTDSSPGTVSLSSILLHEMTHVRHISGPGLTINDVTGRTPRDVQNALEAGVNTTEDANAYSYLGSMAWDLGLGGKPESKRVTCLGNFERADLDSEEYYRAIREQAGLDGL